MKKEKRVSYDQKTGWKCLVCGKSGFQTISAVAGHRRQCRGSVKQENQKIFVSSQPASKELKETYISNLKELGERLVKDFLKFLEVLVLLK